MNRVLVVLLVATLAGAASMIAVTSGDLPPQVASHFDMAGAANGTMSREVYVIATLVFAVGVPLVLFGAFAGLPRLAPRFVNLPERDYWLADERIAATLATLSGFGCMLAIATAVFAVAVHLAVVDANAVAPPRLPARALVTLLTGFGVALGVWFVALLLRFRRRR